MSRIPPAPPANKKNNKQPPKPPAPSKSTVRLLTEDLNVYQQSFKVEPIIPVSQQNASKNVQPKSSVSQSNSIQAVSSIKDDAAQTLKSYPKQSTEYQDRQAIEEPKSLPNQIATQQPPIKKIPPPPNNKGPSKRQMGTPPPPTTKKQIKRSPPKDVAQTQSKTSNNLIGKQKLEQTPSHKHIEESGSLAQDKSISNQQNRQNTKTTPPPFNKPTKQIPKSPSAQLKKTDPLKIQTQTHNKQLKREINKPAQSSIDQTDEIKINQKLKSSINPIPDKQQITSQFESIAKQNKSPIIEKPTNQSPFKAKNKFEQKLERLQKARELMKHTKQQQQQEEEEIDLQQQLSASHGSQNNQQQYEETTKPTDTFQDQFISKNIQQDIHTIQHTQTKNIHNVPPVQNSQQQFYTQQLQYNFSHLQPTVKVQPINNLQNIQPSKKQSRMEHKNIQNQKNISTVPQQPKIALILQPKKQNPQIHQLLQKYHSLKNVYLNNLRQLDELVHFQKQQEDHQVQKINHLLNQLSKKNEAIKKLCDSKIPSQQGVDQQDNNGQQYAEDQFTV